MLYGAETEPIYFMQPPCKEKKFSCFILIFDDYKIIFYSEIDDIYTYIIRSTVISWWSFEPRWD